MLAPEMFPYVHCSAWSIGCCILFKFSDRYVIYRCLKRRLAPGKSGYRTIDFGPYSTSSDNGLSDTVAVTLSAVGRSFQHVK
jgi:hypothetical protein